MRLSEAVMLGRHLVPESRTEVWDRCAIGMASRAVSDGTEFALKVAVKQWPWLGLCTNWECPFCTFNSHLSTDSKNNAYMIGHVFDGHVISAWNQFRMTLEQLCDWIRSIEPAEDAEPARLHSERDHIDSGTGPVIHEHASETV